MLLYVSALHSFLWLNNIPLHGNMYIYTHTPFCLFIYQWMNWWCFYLLTMDNAAMNIHEQVFVWWRFGFSPWIGVISVLAWKIPWIEELASYSPWGRRVRHD